jgi:type II secretory pathway component PulJ
VEPAGEYRGGASTAALVICIIIAVVGVVVAFGFYSKWDDQQRTIQDQGQQVTELKDKVTSLEADLAQLREKTGFENGPTAEAAVAAIPDVVPATAKRALEVEVDRATQAGRLAQETETKYQTASQELDNLRKQLADTQTAKDAEIQKLQDEKTQMEATDKTEIKNRDDLITQLRTEKRAAEDAAQKAKDELEETAALFKSQDLTAKGRIAQMSEKLRIIEEKAESPDGYIVAMDSRTGYGSINLGAVDHVQPGMIFQVYNLGRGGDNIPRTDLKGRIQVREVERNSSVVSIIESVPNRAVVKGDYVMTALLAKKKPVFVIAGWFPPSLGYSQGELKALAERWGGEVAPEVTLDTDYLVVGKIRVEGEEASPEAGKEASEGLAAYNLARELAVHILNAGDFVKLVQR